MGRVPGRGGGAVGPRGGLADDGKRSGVYGTKLNVLFCFSERRNRRGFGGGKGSGSGRIGGLADDGKRCEAVDVASSILISYIKGGV